MFLSQQHKLPAVLFVPVCTLREATPLPLGLCIYCKKELFEIYCLFLFLSFGGGGEKRLLVLLPATIFISLWLPFLLLCSTW